MPEEKLKVIQGRDGGTNISKDYGGTKVRAITLWQPWASLIVCGTKKIETRSWSTKIRGTVAIHAAKKVPLEAIQLLATKAFQEGLKILLPINMKYIIMEFLPRGKVIGTVDIIDCVEIVGKLKNGYPLVVFKSEVKSIVGPEVLFGDFTRGRYAWILENPVMFEKPIPAMGSQGFWNWNEGVIK
jgi:hypothetical protein